MRHTMKQPPQPLQEDDHAEEVAAWFLRMQSGESSLEDRQAFESWLAQSETHRDEYRSYETLWHNLDQLGNVPLRKPRGKAGILAGLLVLVMAGASTYWYTGLGEVFATDIGERRHVVLTDGTALDLNTDSKVRVEMEKGLRRITLVRGEVLVSVGKDARPFEVNAKDGILRDIGTTFNVRSDGETTNVAVLEGEVQVNLYKVEPVHLQGGQQVDYRENAVSAIVPVKAADATAWLNGRLIFRDTPLPEVVKQINRYHARPVELADASLGSLKVCGEFNSSDRAGLLEALKLLLALDSTEHLGATELSRRR